MREVAIKQICEKGSSSLKQKELLSKGEYVVYGAGGIAGYLNTFHQPDSYIGIVKDGSGIGRVDFYPPKTSLIGTMQYILPKKGYNIRYIGYCLQSLDLSAYKQGAAIPHIYFRDYGERIVRVTDNEIEQQKIVSRLDAAFAHIDELKANAEKQLNDARALFQKALEKATEPKEGWEVMKLGEFAYMKAGNFAKASEIYPDYKEGLFPCYGGNGFRGYVKEPNQNGDYCMIGRQGALCGCINRAQGLFRTTEHAVIVKPYKEIPTSLVYYLLVSLKLNKYATGAAQPGLSVNNIAEAVKIAVPPQKDQQKIANRLDALSEHVKALEENQRKVIAECDALKQAMLREVFE